AQGLFRPPVAPAADRRLDRRVHDRRRAARPRRGWRRGAGHGAGRTAGDLGRLDRGAADDADRPARPARPAPGTPKRQLANLHLVTMLAATTVFAVSWFPGRAGYQDGRVHTAALVLAHLGAAGERVAFVVPA